MVSFQVFITLLLGLALCIKDGASVDNIERPKEKLFAGVIHVHTIKPGASLISSFGELKSKCVKDVSHVLVTFESATSTSFQLLTNLRYKKNFDVFEYDSFSLNDSFCQLKGASGSSFSFDIMPGKITQVAMENNKISPYVDVLTLVKCSSAAKNIALVINCEPKVSVKKRQIDKFSYAYFDGIPYEDLIVEENVHARIEATKFVHGGVSENMNQFETKIKTRLTPGLVYRAKLATPDDTGKIFEPFIGVQYAGNYDGPRYPELESGSFFRLDAPFWPAPQLDAEEPNGTAFIRIIHDPRFEYKLVIENWWEPTVALIFRRNIDAIVWLFIAFVISSSGLLGVAVGLAGFVRLASVGNSAWIETSLILLIAYCLATSVHWIISSMFALISESTGFRRAYFMAIKVVPLVIFLPCLFLQLWSLIPFLLAMQLLVLQTIFSFESKAESKASSFLLQLITLAMYVSVRIPDIMAAVQYHVPMPFEVEKEVVWLWALIVWGRLSPSGRKTSPMKQVLRAAFLSCLILGFLPKLQLCDVWPAFCLHLTINLITSFI